MINENLIIEISNIRAYKGKQKPKLATGIQSTGYKIRNTKGYNKWLKYVTELTQSHQI